MVCGGICHNADCRHYPEDATRDGYCSLRVTAEGRHVSRFCPSFFLHRGFAMPGMCCFPFGRNSGVIEQVVARSALSLSHATQHCDRWQCAESVLCEQMELAESLTRAGRRRQSIYNVITGQTEFSLQPVDNKQAGDPSATTAQRSLDRLSRIRQKLALERTGPISPPSSPP